MSEWGTFAGLAAAELKNFLSHQHTFAGQLRIEKPHSALSLVDGAPHLEHIKPLCRVCGIANRWQHFNPEAALRCCPRSSS